MRYHSGMGNTDDYSDRYEEILRRIEARKQTNLDASRQVNLASVLDGLNALGFLDDLRRKRLPGISLYGPKAVKGANPQQWAGAVSWYKPRGYHHYRTLTLLGIWALETDGAVPIIIGQKTLEFDLPIFNPESYYRRIKDQFELAYADDGCPPPENARLYTAVYQPSERLTIRDAIQKVLSEWAKHLKPGWDEAHE
jgi:hypothetical protein